MTNQGRSLEHKIRQLKFLVQSQTNTIENLLWPYVESGRHLCPSFCQQIAEYQEILNDRVTAVVDEFEKSIIDEEGLRFIQVGDFRFTYEVAEEGEHLLMREDKSCPNTQAIYNQLMSEPSGEGVMMHYNR